MSKSSNPNPFARFVFSERLRQIAQKQAKRMANENRCFHTPNLSENFGEFTALAENVASGQPTFEHAVIDWMNSPGHRANILNPEFTHIGGGVDRGKDGLLYWVVIFGGK